MPVIECVPNVSEGQRQGTIDALGAAIRRVPDVHLLDVSSDPSHNRSVLTMVGPPAALKTAVLALFEVAVSSIDLRSHRGEHPRVGAVDVVPFIPLEGATMQDCAALARDTASEVATRFGVPVFLYEHAASSPARTRLEDIRRGQFEGLASKMASPDWTPDFGPSRPHPTAGASVIGVRMPLVAFNINLATDRLDVARAIARVVRESGGGLPAVKAMGVMLEDRAIAQVSMNLTDFRRTPLHTVFEAVSREADRHGVQVLESEVIGLVPAAALPDAPERVLKLARFSPDQVLESRCNLRPPHRLSPVDT